MEGKLNRAMKETEEEINKEEKRKVGWWDEECLEKKREARKELRRWRRKGGKGEEYKRRKQKFREICERKKKEENDRWEKRAAEVSRESEVWEIVNRERKKRRKVTEGIEMAEWKEHFMRLLGGVEGRVVKGGRERSREGERSEEKISKEKVRRVLKKLKEGKAAGVDGIPSEV